MIRRNKVEFKKAFGIVEVLIASTIMVVIIFALTAAGRNSLRAVLYMHERGQATYLAQEGIELSRQVRDTAWIDQQTNQTSFAQFVSYVGGNKAIVFNPSTSHYDIVNDDGVNSNVSLDNMIFNRTIVFSGITANQAASLLPANSSDGSTNVRPDLNAVKVTVNVSWTNNNALRTVSISEILTDWRPKY